MRLTPLADELRNEDVSETMYRETLKVKDLTTKNKLSSEQVDSKVNRICDALLAVLEQEKYKNDHLQNIITSHVCKVPADLEAGLEMIGRLQSKSADRTQLNFADTTKLPKTLSLIGLRNTSASLQTLTSCTTHVSGSIISSLHCLSRNSLRRYAFTQTASGLI
jgi:hypothetical protein